MSSRQQRPALQAPDLSVVPRPAPQPTSANDPRFDAAAALETPEALAHGLRTGAVTVVNPKTAPSVQRSPVEVPTPRRGPETSLSTKVPEYVLQQLRRRYADTGVTIRNQILYALRRDGLEVREEDMQDERKRPKSR